jgi:hypothetical protein
MVTEQEHAQELHDDMKELYVELGYHLQMMQSGIERGDVEEDCIRSMEDNLDTMKDKANEVYYLFRV